MARKTKTKPKTIDTPRLYLHKTCPLDQYKTAQLKVPHLAMECACFTPPSSTPPPTPSNTTPERTILGRFSQVTVNPNIIPMFSSSRILQLPLRLWWTPLIFPCSLSTYSGYPYVPHLPNLPVHCRQLHLAISLTFDVRCCSWGSYKRSLHSNTPASHLFQIPLKIRLLIFIISLVYFYLYTVLPNAEVP